jgi:hypothetical protein
MKIAKYILSIFLIIGGFGFIAKGNFIVGLFTLILGVILLPPISEKIKGQVKFFKNKNIRYGIYIGLFIIAGVLMPKKNTENFNSKEDVLISYIKNNKSDKSLQNIKRLAEIGSMFENSNYSLRHPHDGYISEEYDSIKNVAVLIFDPKFDYDDSDNTSFLKKDTENGKLKGYSVQYEINKNDSVILKKTTITYTNIIKEFLSISDVPNVKSFVDEGIIKQREKQLVREEKFATENRKLNDIMGDDDFWDNYDHLVKKRIYKLIIEKNCNELQNEYNTAANIMEGKQTNGIRATKEVELVSFLDDKMRDLECY